MLLNTILANLGKFAPKKFIQITAFNKCLDLKAGHLACVNEFSTKSTTEQPKQPKRIETMSKLLSCQETEVLNMYKTEPLLANKSIPFTKQRLKFLIKNKVSRSSIFEFPFLLTNRNLQINLELLKQLKPTDINHFIPLLLLEPSKLQTFEWMCPKDDTDADQKHFIYYFSDKTQTRPQTICTYLVRHPKIFKNCSLSTQLEKLDTLLKYIKVDYILRNLFVFKYTTQNIVERMKQANAAGIDCPRPWMIICSENRFKLAIENRLNEKGAIGKNADVVQFYSEKLSLDMNITRDLFNKQPAMWTYKLRRISKIIDYLLNKANYTADDIVDCPRIFQYSLKTIVERIETAKFIGSKKMRLSLVAQGSDRFKNTLHIGNRVKNE